MVHTGATGQQADKTFAHFYRLDNGKSMPQEVLSVLGAGGLYSTAEDLVRFADSFSKDGKHALTQSSIDEMKRAHPSPFALKAITQTGINPEFSFGLGLDVAGLPYYRDQGLDVIGKGGDTGYYHSMLLSDVDHRISVAVIEAGQGSSAAEITFNTFNAILTQKGLLKDEPAPFAELPAPQPIPPKYGIFQGYYASAFKVTFDFTKNLCNLAMLNSGGVIQLTYYDKFFYLGKEKFAFITVDGQNYLLSALFNNMEYDILGEQLPTLQNPQSLSSDINGAAWLRRNVQPYEDAAVSSTHIVTSRTFDDLKGYVLFSGLKEIKASDYAAIPTWAVRDQTELKLFNVDGQVWAQAYDCIYSPATLAKPIGIGTCSVTIGSDGYNQWFKVSQDATLSFLKPTWDRVIVYSATGSPMYDSMLSTGDVSVAQGCLVEFAGHPGDTMSVTSKID